MSGVQSIERAFAILRALARGPLGVTDIAERTDLPKSTVFRLLAALENEGAVEQPETGGGYGIGSVLAMLGGAAAPRATLRSIVRPYLEELSMLSGGSAGFTVLDGHDVYWVDNVDDGNELVRVADLTGQTFPLHTVPTGLALLARFDTDELDEYFAEPLETLHDHTVIDPTVLRQRLARVGADGVLVSRDEVDPGVNAVAAAFRGPSGQWEGALYLQGPSFRFPDDGDERRVIKLVAESAAQLSDRLVGR